MKFGDYLRHLRIERGWTQPEAAGRAGIEQSYLSKLETGKSVPSGEIYDRLVGIYSIDDAAMLDVLIPEELERLREIDSLRTAILSRSDRRRAVHASGCPWSTRDTMSRPIPICPTVFW